MSERNAVHDTEVVVQVLRRYTQWDGFDWEGQEDQRDNIRHQAAAVVAELVRASTVTTEAELNALPAKTVIHDRDGEVFVYEDELERGWFYPGDDDPLPSRMIDLPATVLFRPV